MLENHMTILHRILAVVSTIVIAIANMSVVSACMGNWYQPIVPTQLRKE